jgi:DNA-binding transcriptional MerR regulator/methylmalonyl-CoA mutase cobalamin-binding subunit
MPISKAPAFNLKVVLRETGLAADTLRAWERRYGLPVPQRSPGGHRLYSQHDIETVKWLVARQNEGLSISRAVELWKDELSQGRDPLAELESRPATGLSSFQQPIFLPPETNIDAIRAHWLAACLNFNESVAEQALNQAFSMYPVETVCVDVLQRGMAELGMLWYEGRASVQQEHFASGLAMRRLDALLSASPSPTRGKTILVGCPPEEWHTFSALMLTLFLRRRGLSVIYLGANVPINRFEETVAAVSADLVLLAAHHLVSAATLQQTSLQLSAQGAKVVYGGRIFNLQPGIRQNIPGHFLGERLDTSIENVERLLVEFPDAPQMVFPSNQHVETLRSFVLKRPLVEAAINQQIQTPGAQQDYLETAHRYLGNNIIAALQLGNIHYLESEIDWLVHMLKSHQQPTGAVYTYLVNYASAVRQHLGEQGALIVNWMETKKANL